MPFQPDQLDLNGVTYDIISQDTTEEMEARGLVNIAELYRQNGVAREYGLRRPRGRRIFSVHEYEDGRFGSLTKLPY